MPFLVSRWLSEPLPAKMAWAVAPDRAQTMARIWPFRVGSSE